MAEKSVIGAVRENIRKIELGAARNRWGVDRAEGSESYERHARIFARELGRPMSVTVCRELDQRSVHELRVERIPEILLGAHEHAAPLDADQSRADARAGLLAR